MIFEDHDILPFDVVHLSFDSVDDLLNFLEPEGNSCYEYLIDRISTRWRIIRRTPDELIQMCREDGFCAICNGKVDPMVSIPEIEREKNTKVCRFCGKFIREEKDLTLSDIFYQNTQKRR
jgi:hypothetical protein